MGSRPVRQSTLRDRYLGVGRNLEALASQSRLQCSKRKARLCRDGLFLAVMWGKQRQKEKSHQTSWQ